MNLSCRSKLSCGAIRFLCCRRSCKVSSDGVLRTTPVGGRTQRKTATAALSPRYPGCRGLGVVLSVRYTPQTPDTPAHAAKPSEIAALSTCSFLLRGIRGSGVAGFTGPVWKGFLCLGNPSAVLSPSVWCLASCKAGEHASSLSRRWGVEGPLRQSLFCRTTDDSSTEAFGILAVLDRTTPTDLASASVKCGGGRMGLALAGFCQGSTPRHLAGDLAVSLAALCALSSALRSNSGAKARHSCIPQPACNRASPLGLGEPGFQDTPAPVHRQETKQDELHLQSHTAAQEQL